MYLVLVGLIWGHFCTGNWHLAKFKYNTGNIFVVIDLPVGYVLIKKIFQIISIEIFIICHILISKLTITYFVRDWYQTGVSPRVLANWDDHLASYQELKSWDPLPIYLWLKHSPWIRRLGFWVPLRLRHFQSQKLWHFHKDMRSCVKNECCCRCTVNISNVIFTSTRQIWGIWKLRPAYSPETPNLGQNRWCFVPCDLEIWLMTLENNRAPLLCCFKLCATFHSHRWIQTEVAVRKRPIWVKFDDF